MAKVSNPFVWVTCTKCGREIQCQILARTAVKEIDDLRDKPDWVCAQCYSDQ